MQVPHGEQHQMVYVGPVTQEEDQPKQRVFHKGRCIKYLCSGKAICNYIVGGYVLIASTMIGYINTNDILINPPSTIERWNVTTTDLAVYGTVAVVVDIVLAVFAILGAGFIIQTCYHGIKEGRVQRNQSPLLVDETA